MSQTFSIGHLQAYLFDVRKNLAIVHENLEPNNRGDVFRTFSTGCWQYTITTAQYKTMKPNNHGDIMGQRFDVGDV